MKNFVLWITAVFVLILLPGSALSSDKSAAPRESFTLYPIGQVKKHAGRTTIVIDKKYQSGLLGLDKYPYIHVLYWFDRNDTPSQRAILQIHPRGNKGNAPSGVFATRSPVRPNLIALSLCRIISIKDNVIEIEGIDAFPDTPVLDIKPYVRGMDTIDRGSGGVLN